MNCPNCNAEVARTDEHRASADSIDIDYWTCQSFDFRAAYQSERTKRAEAEAIAGRMREVLHEIVGDHELIELLREPDTDAHGSTLGRAKTALESAPATIGAELRAMEEVCEAAATARTRHLVCCEHGVGQVSCIEGCGGCALHDALARLAAVRK
jgi:hypothetical protein